MGDFSKTKGQFATGQLKVNQGVRHLLASAPPMKTVDEVDWQQFLDSQTPESGERDIAILAHMWAQLMESYMPGETVAATAEATFLRLAEVEGDDSFSYVLEESITILELHWEYGMVLSNWYARQPHPLLDANI